MPYSVPMNSNLWIKVNFHPPIDAYDHQASFFTAIDHGNGGAGAGPSSGP